MTDVGALADVVVSSAPRAFASPSSILTLALVAVLEPNRVIVLIDILLFNRSVDVAAHDERGVRLRDAVVSGLIFPCCAVCAIVTDACACVLDDGARIIAV